MNIIDRIKRNMCKKDVASQVLCGDVLYHALTPASDIQNGQEYMTALDWALAQEDVRNIAISGPYGAGKSSVINTYFKTRKRKDVLSISLAAFNLESVEVDKVDNDKLELGILKQLFYHVRADKIPKSRYRKLQPENWITNSIISTIVEFLLLIFLYFAFPNQVKAFVISTACIIGGWRKVLLVAVLAAVWCACCTAVRWFRRSGSVQEIKILDKATLKNGEKDETESVFNKNMDEIIYFFEETGYKIVVIEDLDRFDNTDIFVDLRELNNLLNHYEGIDYKITFIYAIKDDMFQEEGERTKFFDFIIPIVPYISSTNSGEILREKLQFDDEKSESCLYDISEQYISLISPYISDMRDLICICNEFIVFKNTLKGNQHLNLNDQQMFSLIVFKNLFPMDFAQLEDETFDSIVRRAFEDKKAFIASKAELLNDKRREQAEAIRKIECETLNSIRDLKVVLLMCMMNYNYLVKSISDGKNTYSYADILRDNFDMDILKKKRLIVYYVYEYGSTSKIVNDIEKEVKDNNGNYFERLEHVKKGLESCKEEAKRTIEDYEQRLNMLRTYSIRQIIEEFGTEFLSIAVKKNDLLVFLLRNGFIDENYADYINYFHPNSISKDEMNFILSIRNRKPEMEYTYPLKNVSQIFDRLQDYEFQQKEILNYDLVDYVLEENADSSSERFLIGQLSNHSQDSMSFIKAYVERGVNINRMVMLLCHENELLWRDICKDTGISLETRFKYLGYILSYAELEDIVAQDGENKILTEFFLIHPEVLEKLKGVPAGKQIHVIDALELVFTNLKTGNLEEIIKQHIFDNCCYELNKAMLLRLTEWKKPEITEELKKKNYTSIRAIDYKPLTDYIHNNFEDYVSHMILDSDSNTEEDIDTVEEIIERLCPDNLELALSVLEKEKVVWENIVDCFATASEKDEREYRQKIRKYLLDNNRISCTWENCEEYFREYGADETWIAYIVRNIDSLVSKADSLAVTDEIRETLLFAELPEEVFRKVITRIYKKAYEDDLSKIDSVKIRILIEEHLLPFNIDYWNRLYKLAPDLRVLYAVENNQEFIQSLASTALTAEEVNQMLGEKRFSVQAKLLILNKLKPDKMTMETARIIRRVTNTIPKEYVESAWELLPGEERYELLLNQIDVYQNEELPVLFNQLSPEYQQFVERSRHKYLIAHTDYNVALLEKLKARDYITSIDAKWVEKTDKAFASNVKEYVLTGFVKQSN